ncbi:DUF2029 domain-containing protein [Candidatus Woesebacteria bacterium]|nr:DUF2029 domain-containing protein [Candidatus Woesebacteria bacterium]QQG47719.1 MAG: DUF2029 domain-containing protein [Candidatus Woesebacteria bacterium]
MNKFLQKIHAPAWVVLVLAFVVIFRIPSLFEPYSYGDEMIYMTLGTGVRQGLTLYKDIHDNKPPLLYYLAGFSGSLVSFKAILLFWSLVTVYAFWKLTLMMFPKKEKLQKAATTFFAIITTLPLLEGNIVNAENFLIGFIILGFFIALRYKKNWALIVAGILFSLAALFKIPAAFDLPALILYFFITEKNKKDIIRKTLIISVAFLVPIIFFFVWYYTKGALFDYIKAAYLENVGYLSSFRPGDIQKPFLVRNAPLLGRGAIVLIGTIILFIKRKKLSLPFILGTVWLLTSLFAATLSERPYPHYLLQVAAPASILVAILIGYENIEQSFAIIPLFLALLVPVYYKYYHYNTISYYNRFLSFATGRITKQQYFSEFDGNVIRNYMVSDFLSKTTMPGTKVFVWGDSPPIYALSRRLPPLKYVAPYHINDFTTHGDVISALNKNKPAYIVVLPNSDNFPELYSFLARNYFNVLQLDGANIWRLNTKL